MKSIKQLKPKEIPTFATEAQYKEWCRQQFEAEFGGSVFMVRDYDGSYKAVQNYDRATTSVEAVNTGRDPKTGQFTTKTVTTPKTAENAPQRELHVPPVTKRMGNYGKALAFDMFHRTNELAIYRDAIRRAKQDRLRKQFGLF